MNSQKSFFDHKQVPDLTVILMLMLGMVFFSMGAQAAPKHSADPYETAIEHAKLAVKAGTLEAVQMHLHHVLNCLEGEHGKDFDAAAGNPCNGRGALETLKKGTANWIRANNSIALARVGVILHDEKPAHYVAEAVLAILSESKP